ncbi:hypothetical protein D3C86_1632380 [compost metagenome]
MPGIPGEAGSDGPRLDFHDPHAERRQFHAQGIAQGMHGGFRGAVGAGEWRDQHTRNAADIHDQSFGPAQHGKHRASDANDSEHIGFELALHGRYAAIEQRSHGAITSVVD